MRFASHLAENAPAHFFLITFVWLLKVLNFSINLILHVSYLGQFEKKKMMFALPSTSANVSAETLQYGINNF